MEVLEFVSTDDIRLQFAHAMSRMYQQEVPLYAELLAIVDDVNRRELAADPEFAAQLERHGEFDRLNREYHGAIRLGTAEELSMMRRVFAVMGMYPVGYYDLSVAGIPVHSTAFRPVQIEQLNRNPFRVFTSLLRLDLIENTALRDEALALLETRQIFSAETIRLVEQFEQDGGLGADAAARFVAAVLETFRWQSETLVDHATYARLLDIHRLVADIVCFRGPHINHLTPRTLDIDAAQGEMLARGIEAKTVIEGPPPRDVPILLRQTSFKALKEEIRFLGDAEGRSGTHTARFGEIEQRGVALTPKGRVLYDSLLAETRGGAGSQPADHDERMASAFRKFPDDLDSLRREGLAYFRYELAGAGAQSRDVHDLEALIAEGIVDVRPIVYEDFLPVSAAGIFQSNLGGGEQRAYNANAAQSAFEEALGSPVADPFALYEAIERDSIAAVHAALGSAMAEHKIK